MELDSPRLMGILNVTPDSFSDGGLHLDVDAAVHRALAMIDEGACMIDIGGESTRPSAAPVTPAEQIARTVPVILKIRSTTDVPISIDTTSSQVADAALNAGADIINDVSAGTDDSQMLRLAAISGAGMVLMHRRVAPRQDSYSDQYARPPEYDDVIETVSSFIAERVRVAAAAGVDADRLLLDPGLGFGKTVTQNFELLQRLPELGAAVGGTQRVLCAASRKSFIGRASGVETPAMRVTGSVAAAVIACMHGVRLFRVHDVAAHREALRVAWAASCPHRQESANA